MNASSLLPFEISWETFLKEPEAYTLVDVRREDEYAKVHIQGSLLAPLGEPFLQFLEGAGGHLKTYLFVCAHGYRSLQAVHLAMEIAGIQGQSLRGGMKDWIEAGLPVMWG